MLGRLQTVDKTVFEGWTHALAYVPVEEFRHFVRGMRDMERSPSRWFDGVTAADRKRLLKRIRADGSISIREIDEEKRDKDHEWASRKPSKRALEHLFFSGRVAIQSREGMVKRYELLERHFGWSKRLSPSTLSEEASYVLDRALRAQGLVTLESAMFLETEYRERLRRLIAQRIKRGELVSVTVEGLSLEFVAKPETLLDQTAIDDSRVHLLSPFDPVVIQRKRVKTLFGLDYTFEAYVPAAKRKYGYFVLPVLAGDRFVARLDLKVDREGGRLLVKSWHWEPGAKDRRGLKQAIEKTLGNYERFSLRRQKDATGH